VEVNDGETDSPVADDAAADGRFWDCPPALSLSQFSAGRGGQVGANEILESRKELGYGET